MPRLIFNHRIPLLIAFFALSVLTASRSQAQLCLPQAIGVPTLPGPPHWTVAPPDQRTELNDPRWSGAARRSFSHTVYSGGSEAAEVTFRGLSSGTDLYLSFQTLADAGGATPDYDAVYVGVAPQDNSQPARLLKFVLKTAAAQTAGVWIPGNTTLLDVKEFRRPADGSGSWAAAPLSAATFIPDAAVWIDPVQQTWALQLRMDTAALGWSSGIKAFYAFNVQFTTSPPPGKFLQFSSPLVGAFSDTALASINPGVWPNLVLGGGCTDGVSISAMAIGTTNVPSSNIDPNTNNTFFANPTFPTTGAMANLPAGAIKAHFRLANWGAQMMNATWDEFGQGTSAGVSGGAGGGIQYVCVQAAGPNQCPQRGTHPAHQCMLVELEGTGVTNIDFTRDSAFRNMDFANNSEFERDAEINIAGLPQTTSGFRDVYVYVKTVNMPPPGDERIALPIERMRETLQEVGQEATPGPNNDGTATVKRTNKSPPPGRSVHEELSEVWPTYEVHVYYDTGETINVGGSPQLRLSPMVPFGYFVSHKGPLYGFSHSFDAVDGSLVEEIAPNFYRIWIADGKKATVRTRIASLDRPKSASLPPIVVKPGCYCRAVGGPARKDPISTTLASLLMLAVVLRVSRRRNLSAENDRASDTRSRQ